jgi:tetratricopeptide (TPR) repeat protein
MIVDEILNRAMAAYREGRLADALVILREARKIDPANPRIRSFMALLSGGTAGMTPIPGAMPAFAPPGGATAPRAPGAAPPSSSAPASAASPAAAPATGPNAPPRPTRSAPVTMENEYAPAPWDDGPSVMATIVVDSSGAGLDLEAVEEKSDLRPLVPQAPAKPIEDEQRREVDTLMKAAHELHGLGDFSGSLELIEKILLVSPDHAEAREFLAQNEAQLFAMYESKLQPLTNVPRLAIKPEEVMWLNLDHRAGFLLSQIDGQIDYESLFALSGLPRLDTARILASLLSEGVIQHGR